MKRALTLIAAMASALVVNLLPAQAQEDEGDVIICVGGARSWSGSPTEVARIRIEPVPASFRALDSYRGPCGNGLVRWSLMNWHLYFGTEETSLAALEYLGGAKPPDWASLSPEEYDQQLEGLREAFLAATESGAIGDQAIAQGGFFNIISDGIFVTDRAEALLTHAEVFRSEALLGEAAPLIEAVDQLAEIFVRQTDDLDFSSSSDVKEVLLNFELAIARIKARRALLQAQFSGTSADAVRAAAHLEESYDPAFEYVLEEVNSGRILDCEGFDYHDEDSVDLEIADTCSRLDTNGGGLLLEAALEFYHRAHLASLLMERHGRLFVADPASPLRFRLRRDDDPEADENADRRYRWAQQQAREDEYYLVEAASANRKIYEGPDGGDESFYSLPSRLAVLSALASTEDPSVERWEMEQQMSQLFAASLRVPPSDWPSLWRQLAARYLSLHEEYARLLAEEGDGLSAVELFRVRQFEAQMNRL